MCNIKLSGNEERYVSLELKRARVAKHRARLVEEPFVEPEDG